MKILLKKQSLFFITIQVPFLHIQQPNLITPAPVDSTAQLAGTVLLKADSDMCVSKNYLGIAYLFYPFVHFIQMSQINPWTIIAEHIDMLSIVWLYHSREIHIIIN